MGLQWSGEMKQFVSSQGCYIGSFLGTYYSITYKLISTVRGANSYLNVDGQVVMWRIIILSNFLTNFFDHFYDNFFDNFF
jgi:hypothetical protein